MGLFAALHFLTTIPLTARRTFTPRQLGESLAYYPLVGALVGGCLVVCHIALRQLFDLSVTAALLLVLWVLLTGGLHLDGFMDACDGLLSHRATEDRLRIMRDVHIGAWGAIGVALLLLAKFALLQQARLDSALLLAPTLARWALSLCVVAFPYGRDEGWGRSLKAHAGRRQLALATIGMTVIVLVVQPAPGALALACTVLAALVLVRFALDRLPGLTGDVYGMITELCEAVVLLVFSARLA